MRVFVSHATRDHVAVETVRRQLEAIGVEPYLAEHDGRAGERLSAKVESALRRSDIVVAVLTSAGFGSAFVQQEIGLAHGAGTLVVPLVDPKLEPIDLGLLGGVE